MYEITYFALSLVNILYIYINLKTLVNFSKIFPFFISNFDKLRQINGEFFVIKIYFFAELSIQKYMVISKQFHITAD